MLGWNHQKERGFLSMKNKNVMNYFTRKGLELLERRAEKKANAECIGMIYEPEVPKKLKKTALKGLVCMLTAASMLVGSMGVYKASYSNCTWSTYKVNSAVGSQSYIAALYDTEETYEWAVTSCNYTEYAYVELNGVNNTVLFLDEDGEVDTSIENKLSKVGKRSFIRVENAGNTNPYMIYEITMNPYKDGFNFGGYIKIK